MEGIAISARRQVPPSLQAAMGSIKASVDFHAGNEGVRGKARRTISGRDGWTSGQAEPQFPSAQSRGAAHSSDR
ncbi:hypothetical protein PF008_g12328 [Phytophthora fragariae]|uniref:Uncharacterized protein n=1 Tax=Phytophthora fragariae TaxID=53985 RepID=A0A6G0RN45_9STRA|nr:hypothetical protein PF008_g12328 [Phytophthora fragariae]